MQLPETFLATRFVEEYEKLPKSVDEESLVVTKAEGGFHSWVKFSGHVLPWKVFNVSYEYIISQRCYHKLNIIKPVQALWNKIPSTTKESVVYLLGYIRKTGKTSSLSYAPLEPYLSLKRNLGPRGASEVDRRLSLVGMTSGPTITLNLPKEFLSADFDDDEGETDVTASNTLYQITEGDHKGKYAYKIAIDRSGRAVMQLKAGDDVIPIDFKHIEEVMPFTVDIVFDKSNSSVYSYFSKESDALKVGDIILVEGSNNFARVVGVDTKARSANRWLVGSVIRADAVLTAGE